MASPKRRILRKIKLSEISAVDFPCQDGAVMTIMKRDPQAAVHQGARLEILEDRIQALQGTLSVLTKAFDPNQMRDAAGKWAGAGASWVRNNPSEAAIIALGAAGTGSSLVALAVSAAGKVRRRFWQKRAMSVQRKALAHIIASGSKNEMRQRVGVLTRQVARDDRITVQEAKGRIRLAALDMKAASILRKSEATLEQRMLEQRIEELIRLLS